MVSIEKFQIEPNFKEMAQFPNIFGQVQYNIISLWGLQVELGRDKMFLVISLTKNTNKYNLTKL